METIFFGERKLFSLVSPLGLSKSQTHLVIELHDLQFDCQAAAKTTPVHLSFSMQQSFPCAGGPPPQQCGRAGLLRASAAGEPVGSLTGGREATLDVVSADC